MPDDGMRRELVEGRVLTMEPSGFNHGRVAATANRLLGAHAHATGIGATVAAETGFILATDPDTVRAPDAAFVSRARVEAVGETVRFWPGAPDFALEVASPGDGPREIEAKAKAWLAAGTSAVLVLDPAAKAATVYRPGCQPRTSTDGQLDLTDAVPGWRVAVADFFA